MIRPKSVTAPVLVALASILWGEGLNARGDTAVRPEDDPFGNVFGLRDEPSNDEPEPEWDWQNPFVSQFDSQALPEPQEWPEPPPPGPVATPEQTAGIPPTVATPLAAARPRVSVPQWEWHLLPGDLLQQTFIAEMHAPRMGGEMVHSNRDGVLLDTTIGGRFALWRFGTLGPDREGIEVQVYAAALTRLGVEVQSDVEAVDYKLGLPLVWRQGNTSFRLGYDHISSHVGDEFLLRNPDFERLNYVRDSIAFAIRQEVTEAVAVYGEVNRAYHKSGGAGTWHLQFGGEYQPPVVPGWRGAPVAAVNTLLRSEFNYEGNLNVITGWQWRGVTTDQLIRLGLTYYAGRSRQFSFFDRRERLVGAGLWYDF